MSRDITLSLEIFSSEKPKKEDRFCSLKVLWCLEDAQVSCLARTQVRAVFPVAVPLDDLLGQNAELTFRASSSSGSSEKVIRGIISEVAILATAQQDSKSQVAPTYELEISALLVRLERSVDCRIFQNSTTKEIVEKVLKEHGIESDAQKWTLSEDNVYETRINCTQYRESALNFISRLLEEEGIHFYSTLADDKSELIVFNDKSVSAKFSPEAALPLRAASHQDSDSAAVYNLDHKNHLHSQKVSTNSFDFTNPRSSLHKAAQGDDFHHLEAYEVADPISTPERSEELAKFRLEEETCRSQPHGLTTDSLDIAPGRKFKVKEDQFADQEFFIVGLRTEFHSKADEEGAIKTQFLVTAQALPATLPFRPRRVHKKTRILGPQSAIVVAPIGTKDEGVYTEKFGRVKVQFHWDRYAQRNEKASCWIRVAQLQTSGSMILPRVNWEVVVEFIEGDPDQPLVTGKLYNRTFMPPYALPEGRTRTSLQSSSSPGGGGTNEIRYEDAAGNEEMRIQSQHNTLINVANNRKKVVTKDESLTVEKNSSTAIGGNRTVKISNGFQTKVDKDRSLKVEGNRKSEVNAVYGLTVGGSSTTEVGGNANTMVGNPLDAIIALGVAKAAAVAGAQADKVFAQVTGAAQGAIDQATAPIVDILDKANDISENMQKLADGQAAASGAILGGAIALPTASDFVSSLAAGPALANEAEGTDSSSGGIAIGSAVSAAVSGALLNQATKLKTAVMGEGASTGGGSAAGSSAKNSGGPAGDLSGFSESDNTKGSGLSEYKVSGAQDETVVGNRLSAAIEAINQNTDGDMTEEVGAASIETIKGNRAESVELASTETVPGFIVVAKGGEVETVKGARQLTIGGALKETIKGDYSIEAGGDLNIIAAKHEFKAKSKITIKCGASSIVVDGSGVTITSPMVKISGSKLKATKSVSDG